MYAIIEDSGTQIKVAEGDVIKVDRRDLPEDTAELTFNRVLMVGGPDGDAKVGQPLVEGASVSADILEEFRDRKVSVVKFKRRQDYHRHKTHRQNYLRVKITGIKS